MSDRSLRAVRSVLPAAFAIVFWGANAVGMRSRLTDVVGLRDLYQNMVLFAVVIAGVSAASTAWARYRPRGRDQSLSGAGKASGLSLVVPFAAGAIGLAAGIWLTRAIVAPVLTADTAGLFARGIRPLAMVGVVFSLIGAVAGDLGVTVVSMASEGTLGRVPRYLWGLFAAVHVLWFVLAWIAVVAMRGRVPGAS